MKEFSVVINGKPIKAADLELKLKSETESMKTRFSQLQ